MGRIPMRGLPSSMISSSFRARNSSGLRSSDKRLIDLVGGAGWVMEVVEGVGETVVRGWADVLLSRLVRGWPMASCFCL